MRRNNFLEISEESGERRDDFEGGGGVGSKNENRDRGTHARGLTVGVFIITHHLLTSKRRVDGACQEAKKERRGADYRQPRKKEQTSSCIPRWREAKTALE